ncbi:FtsX-like permease family protein [Streptococcus sp. DD13]|uniref:FtsX-like permease family protein n=1 Tax=Streptococcus sp. DD13 TaxID=1777881 RepID=UPI000796594D|nr:FtsX-like permease family protein [Streptococcus sp. DD13]KXT78593.1 ABC transporter permease protein [Streptococcus sp. DD13]
MNKKTYWKDVRKSFSSSKGRVVSIASLMALGSFALIGLKVTPPDIRQTGTDFFSQHHTADLAVISDYGLDSSDQNLLNHLNSKADVEYGYFKDVVVKDSSTAFRIFSKPKELSTYELVDGKLPSKRGEIALSSSYQSDYKIGDTIHFTEKENRNGKLVLKDHTFTITGFVYSSEILSSINLGKSTAGSGELDSYAVVSEDTFDSDVYMIARIAYKSLQNTDPYQQAYTDSVYAYKEDVKKLIEDQPSKRLEELKSSAKEAIQQGESKIQEADRKLTQGATELAQGKEAIGTAEQQLTNGRNQIATGQAQLDQAQVQLAEGQTQLADSQARLAQAQAQLASAKETIARKEQELAAVHEQLTAAKGQIDAGQAQFSVAQADLTTKEKQLQAGKVSLDQANEKLTEAKAQLDATASLLSQKESQLAQARASLDRILDPASRQVQETILNKEEEALAQAKKEYSAKEATYQAGLADYSAKYAQSQEAQKQLEAGKTQLGQQEAILQSKTAQYQAGVSQYQEAHTTLQDAKQALAQKEGEYRSGLSQYQSGQAAYEQKMAEFQAGQATLAQSKQSLAEKEAQLAQAKKTLAQKQAEYDQAKAKADPELKQKRQELKEAQEKVDQLSTPTYQVFTRREVPGSEGYISYENNASIIENVGNIFPIVLYFIAALVTFVTMGRFVEEERIKAGTFKALGYQNKDIIRKFVLYGLVTSMVGTAIGILAGHTLLPTIIYNSYKSKLHVAPLQLHFYPIKTLLAILLGLLSAVLPAYLVATRELGEKPTQLLLPKPPTSGSKILLERIRPLWSRMSFTQKVTARNIFRYKQRMFMTIFGVCGSISLLFAGLGVRSSIADLNNRQFTDIIRYDMIVANDTTQNSKEEAELQNLLEAPAVKSHMDIHYETLYKVAGNNKDNQSITTLVIKDQDQTAFQEYIQLKNRESNQHLNLSNKGIILSEKMADLAGVKVGDSLTVQNSEGKDIRLKVAGITEMYMGHFIFMNETTYEQAFGKVATDNANLIRLKDPSTKNVRKLATEFMNLEGVQGVVQNTTLKTQVETIVNSLNHVMTVLIAVSILLATVVLFNLTNINVAERIRELSTIKVLGFYNKEVTFYIYRETIYLSIVGILVGFGLGLGLHQYMVAIIPPDTVMFNPAVGWLIYIIPTLVVLVILTGLGIFVNRHLKKVDMLEALKSVE